MQDRNENKELGKQLAITPYTYVICNKRLYQG